MYDFEHVKMVAMWSGAGAVLTAALAILIGAFLRRRRMAALSLLEDDENEVRPKHVPLVYSWEDFWRDVDGQVPTSDIIEKIHWCGMPKRPKTVTVPTAGITSVTPIDINIGGLTTTGTPTSVTSIWVGGTGSQTSVPWWPTPNTNVSGYYNGTSVYSSAYNPNYPNYCTASAFYPNYSGTYYNLSSQHYSNSQVTFGVMSNSINTTFHV